MIVIVWYRDCLFIVGWNRVIGLIEIGGKIFIEIVVFVDLIFFYREDFFKFNWNLK